MKFSVVCGATETGEKRKPRSGWDLRTRAVPFTNGDGESEREMKLCPREEPLSVMDLENRVSRRR